MRKKRQFPSKHSGIISVSLFIPILITALLSAALCFGVAVKFAEVLQLHTDAMKIDCAYLQCRNILSAEFIKDIHDGKITADFSAEAPRAANPVIDFNSSVIQKLREYNEALELNACIVDENYSLDWMIEAQKLDIPRSKPEQCFYDGKEKMSKRYMLVIDLKPKNIISKAHYIYLTEAVVYRDDTAVTVKYLFTRRKILQE